MFLLFIALFLTVGFSVLFLTLKKTVKKSAIIQKDLKADKKDPDWYLKSTELNLFLN